jgi:hypothetical protein
VSIKIAAKRKAQVDDLAKKLTTITVNISRLKAAKEDDAAAIARRRPLLVEITEAKSDKDAEAVVDTFRRHVLDGLQNVPRPGDSPG